MIIELNKKFIFDRTTQEEIFEFYMKEPMILREFYSNPLRIDSHPDCQFYFSPKGVLRLNDFAWNRKFDCFDFVQQMFQLSYPQAIQKIIIDMELLKSDNDKSIKINSSLKAVKSHKEELTFKVKKKLFTKSDLRFWRKYLLWLTSEHLEKGSIYSLDCLWINDNIAYECNKRDTAFVFHLAKGNNFQAYLVNTVISTKFIINNNRIIIGRGRINYDKSYLVITKSYKDWFLMWIMGVNCVAILSETLYDFPIEIISKFDYVFTLFDPDKTGKRCSVIYRRKYNTIPLLFKTGYKDYSDNLEQFGEEKMIKTIDETKQYYGITD